MRHNSEVRKTKRPELSLSAPAGATNGNGQQAARMNAMGGKSGVPRASFCRGVGEHVQGRKLKAEDEASQRRLNGPRHPEAKPNEGKMPYRGTQHSAITK